MKEGSSRGTPRKHEDSGFFLGKQGHSGVLPQARRGPSVQLQNLCAKADVVCLQEAHGPLEYLHALAVILAAWNLVGLFVF